jgi:hypothetical protein
MIRAGLTRWLEAPPFNGWQAILCGGAAVWIPTVVRVAINGVVTGCEFTPYLPFVLICAILLRWWQAGIVALASVAILGGLFAASPAAAMPCFMPAAAIFLAGSAMMIGTAVLIRRAFSTVQGRDAEEPAGGVVLSVEHGEVWASWRGHGRPVRLGTQRKVSAMMEDILADPERRKRESGE